MNDLNISFVWIIYYRVIYDSEVHDLVDSVYVDKELAKAALEIYKKGQLEGEYLFWLEVEEVCGRLPQSFEEFDDE